MPNSTRARRYTASALLSPGAGCPQKEFVHTPGQVCFVKARRVSSSLPSRTNHAEKAKCNGVSAVCTTTLFSVPAGLPFSSAKMTTSSVACGFRLLCIKESVILPKQHCRFSNAHSTNSRAQHQSGTANSLRHRHLVAYPNQIRVHIWVIRQKVNARPTTVAVGNFK